MGSIYSQKFFTSWSSAVESTSFFNDNTRDENGQNDTTHRRGLPATQSNPIPMFGLVLEQTRKPRNQFRPSVTISKQYT